MADFGNYLMQYAYHGLDSLQARLQDRGCLLGAFSLADIAVASWLQVGTFFGIKLDSHPRVADWFKHCRERPASLRVR